MRVKRVLSAEKNSINCTSKVTSALVLSSLERMIGVLASSVSSNSGSFIRSVRFWRCVRAELCRITNGASCNDEDWLQLRQFTTNFHAFCEFFRIQSQADALETMKDMHALGCPFGNRTAGKSKRKRRQNKRK